MELKSLENTVFGIAASKNIGKDTLPASLGQKMAEQWQRNFPAKNSVGKSGLRPDVGII